MTLEDIRQCADEDVEEKISRIADALSRRLKDLARRARASDEGVAVGPLGISSLFFQLLSTELGTTSVEPAPVTLHTPCDSTVLSSDALREAAGKGKGKGHKGKGGRKDGGQPPDICRYFAKGYRHSHSPRPTRAKSARTGTARREVNASSRTKAAAPQPPSKQPRSHQSSRECSGRRESLCTFRIFFFTPLYTFAVHLMTLHEPLHF